MALNPPSRGVTRRPLRRDRLIAIASLVGATLFWAGNYVVGASAVESIDPLSLVLLRWAIALCPLVVLAHLVENPNWHEVLSRWRWLVGLSLTGMLAYSLLIYAALEHTGAFNASLINAFNPALITLAAAVVLHERLTLRSMIGVGLALIGVLAVLGDGELSALWTGGFGTGELLMIGAICAWTAYTILGRRAPSMPPITSTAVQAVFAVTALTPISVAVGGPTLPTGWSATGALLFIGIFPSVLSYLLWNRALVALPAGSAGVFLNLITVFTAAFTILSGQAYTAAQLIGGAVVIGGVVLTNTSGRKRRRGTTTEGRR